MSRNKWNGKRLHHREKKIRWLSLLLSLFLLLGGIVLVPTQAKADEEDTEQQTKVVRVGYYIAPGFQDYDEDTDTYSGSSYEYLMAIKQYTGWEYVFIPVQFSEGVQMLQDGELDLMNNVSKTAEREETLEFSSYASGSNYGCLIVDADNTSYAYNDYSAFNEMKVGIISTSIFKTYFEDFCSEHHIQPEVIYFDTDDEMTQAEEDGTIDARIVSSSYQDGSRVVAKFAPMDYYFAVPKGEEELIRQLNDAMVDIQTDMPGFEQELQDRYSTKYSEESVILSDDEKKYIEEHPTVTVASESWYPIFYYDDNGDAAGPLANLYEQMEEATGLHFEFVDYDSYEESLEAVKSGETDMILEFPYDFIFADQWGVQLSDFVSDIDIYRVVNENSNSNEIKKIAIYGEPYLESEIYKIYGSDVEYISYDSVEDAADAVLDGKADCTFMNYYTSTTFQNRGRYMALKYILITSLQYKFGFGISDQADSVLKSIIGKGLHTIDESYIESVFQSAVQDNKSQDIEALFYQNSKLFISIIVIIVTIIVLLAAFFFYSKRMKKKNMELERAKKAQSDFLSRMSHDMRTPMNGILGLSYLMEKEENIEIVKGYIPELQESSNFLLQLINDVLDVNKIESGNLVLNPKVCDEEKVFSTIMDMMRPLMEEKNIEFHFHKINIEWQYMLLDQQRVKQIFVNLLNNAVKFTPEGGRIDLIMELISQTDDMIRDRFIIRDTGVGISEDFLPHIFEPFKQEEGLNTDYTKGTGLGLPIVKQLVELMDGTISVKSEKNKGTEITIFINFPLAKRPEREKDESEENNSRFVEPRILRPGLHILLCEDHPLNATIATKLLDRQDAVVTWAKNGKIGVNVFQKSKLHTFDVVLMDIRMPEMDGLAATRALRSLDREDASRVPIIAMSANAYEEDIQKSLEAGMNAHLAKPIEPNLMYETIEKCLNEIQK